MHIFFKKIDQTLSQTQHIVSVPHFCHTFFSVTHFHSIQCHILHTKDPHIDDCETNTKCTCKNGYSEAPYFLTFFFFFFIKIILVNLKASRHLNIFVYILNSVKMSCAWKPDSFSTQVEEM